MFQTLILFSLLCWTAVAQDLNDFRSLSRKQAVAARVSNGEIHLDGILDEPVWKQSHPITDFIQKEPNENAPPTEEMEVRFAYDDHSIYVAARMYNRKQVPIQAPLGRRDAVKDQAEYILVSLDTFHDRRTAYAFGVTATGVRLDRFYSEDDETRFDEGFDPVWDAKVLISDQEWTAELWIPYSQLRFNEREEQVWGVNVQRSTPTLNEMDYWVAVPRTEKGWSSRFGDLTGIAGIRPSKRIEALPYVSGSTTLTGNRDERNPFDDGRNLKRNAGLDFKMGLGPNLTLETTFNPDFGQVEADPAEVNLTNLETFFTEKRPFFLEGANLLSPTQNNNFLNSRRIGAPPTIGVSGDYVDYPRSTTILSAAKLTGRLGSGTSIGALAAATDEEFARFASTDSTTVNTVRVAPRTNYALLRVQQEFGPWSSTISGMANVVHRDIKSGDPLAALLPRTAMTAETDSVLRFNGGQYELRSYSGLSYLQGDAAALERVQRSPVHYFQRPDKDYALLDPLRTSLGGYTAASTFERTGGRHWLWNVGFILQSPGFEPNDMGRLGTADGIERNVTIRYRETNPGRFFRNYSVSFSQINEWNYRWNRQAGGARTELAATFPNFWTANLESTINFRKLDERLTRGGPLIETPREWRTTATLRNRAASKTSWNVSTTIATDEGGGSTRNVNGGISFRPAPRWQLSLNPTYIHEINSQQYVTTLSDGRPETYGNRYIFSFIDRHTWSTQLRMGYTIKPDLDIDVYAEPFAASGRYYDFGELTSPRSRSFTPYTENLKNYDFNIRSFRSNVVLRWEWRPGSILYLVWQQDRRASEALADPAGFGDLFRSLRAPGTNFLAVKMSFWLPVR